MHGHGETVHIPFPFDEEDLKAGEIIIDKIIKSLGSLTSYTLLYAYTLDQLHSSSMSYEEQAEQIKLI